MFNAIVVASDGDVNATGCVQSLFGRMLLLSHHPVGPSTILCIPHCFFLDVATSLRLVASELTIAECDVPAPNSDFVSLVSSICSCAEVT